MENETQIYKFDGPYEFLSLEYPCQVVYENHSYNNAAVLFYALRALNERSRMKIAKFSTNKARQKSLALPDNPEYDNNRKRFLKLVVKAKFDSNPDLREKLLSTKPKALINTVTYLDDWIGIRETNGRGSNMLGKVLMEVREEYINQDQSSNEELHI